MKCEILIIDTWDEYIKKNELFNFKKQIKLQNPEKRKWQKEILKNLYALSDSRERVLHTFESKVFSMQTEGTGFSDKFLDYSNLKILNLKQILQRILIALAQVRAGDMSENLLNEIRQIKHYLYWAKRYY